MSRRTTRIEEALEGDEDLSLDSILDYLGCDSWLVDVFKVWFGMTAASSIYLLKVSQHLIRFILSSKGMESGNDMSYLELTREQLREVEKTKNKLQQARQDISKQLMAERTSDCEVRLSMLTLSIPLLPHLIVHP